MSDTESMSERELAQWMTEEVFSGKPRSVGEALAAADGDPEPPVEPAPDQPEAEALPEPPAEEPPVVVTDTPTQPDAPTEAPPALEEQPDAPTEVEEPQEEETEEDTNVVWAKKKYGDDPAQWAKAAFYQERHITQLSQEKKEAEDLAGQWYEYAQSLESQPQQIGQSNVGMPLSQGEENWIEQAATTNPMDAARQAVYQGNMNLYNGVVARVAEDNPMLAAQIGAQIQMELQQAAMQEQQQQAQAQAQQVHPQAALPIALAQSFVRLGIDLEQNGPKMSEKVGELGEYHPYVQAILNGDDGQRDLAVQAVYDLMRSSSVTKRVVRDEQKAAAIQREGELRREAAGVVTGSPHVAPPKTDSFMDAMQEEWKARRQWGDE